MEQIENRTFEEIQPGDTASLVRTLTYKDIEMFAIMSGDINPAHVDGAFTKSDMQCRERLGGLLRYYHQEAA
jgi:acyl dehydratase